MKLKKKVCSHFTKTAQNKLRIFKTNQRLGVRKKNRFHAPTLMAAWEAFDSAKNHKRQRRKRQSVTAKRERSQ